LQSGGIGIQKDKIRKVGGGTRATYRSISASSCFPSYFERRKKSNDSGAGHQLVVDRTKEQAAPHRDANDSSSSPASTSSFDPRSAPDDQG